MTTVLVVLAAIVIATPIVLACVTRDGAQRNQTQERQDGDRWSPKSSSGSARSSCSHTSTGPASCSRSSS